MVDGAPEGAAAGPSSLKKTSASSPPASLLALLMLLEYAGSSGSLRASGVVLEAAARCTCQVSGTSDFTGACGTETSSQTPHRGAMLQEPACCSR